MKRGKREVGREVKGKGGENKGVWGGLGKKLRNGIKLGEGRSQRSRGQGLKESGKSLTDL